MTRKQSEILMRLV